MSRPGNGNGNGNANGKANGARKSAWNLSKDGMLWKRVLDYTTKEFQDRVHAFIAQLQESVQPADALQGVLLDRIAAGYLRKQILLEAEAAGKEHQRLKTTQSSSGSAAQKLRVSVLAFSSPFQGLFAANILRYEALLDQGFHRDLILLQELKQAGRVALPSPDSKPSKTSRLIEGEVAQSDVG